MTLGAKRFVIRRACREGPPAFLELLALCSLPATAVAKPVEQVISERRREVGPLDGRQSITERSTREFLLEPGLLRGVRGTDQAVRELEELLLLPVSRLEARLDELHDDPA